MNPYSYGWEKLHTAVHSLAGSGELKERLVGAVLYSLIHIAPENDLPLEMRQEFTEFMREITLVAATADEGTVQATVDTFDEMAVHRAIEKIIGFYDRICRHQEPY